MVYYRVDMDPRTKPLLEILKVNSQLFRNCLDGIDDETALQRPNGETNHLAFLGLHLIDTRFFLAGKLGSDVENPLQEVGKDARGIEDIPHFPTVNQLLTVWDAAAASLEAALLSVSEEFLDVDAPFNFPVEDRSWLGGIAFLMQHESYHIGQMALLRKYFGREAMRYGNARGAEGP